MLSVFSGGWRCRFLSNTCTRDGASTNSAVLGMEPVGKETKVRTIIISNVPLRYGNVWAFVPALTPAHQRAFQARQGSYYQSTLRPPP